MLSALNYCPDSGQVNYSRPDWKGKFPEKSDMIEWWYVFSEDIEKCLMN